MTKVGTDGVVSVEESSTLNTELEFTEGVGFDKGFLSAYFVTDFDSQEAVLEDPLILLHQDKISSLPDLLPMLEKVAESSKPLLIIAEDVEGEALATLVVNSIRKTLKAVAVKAPFFGDRRKAFLDDLAIVTGGQVVNPDVGLVLREVGLDVLGSARRVVVSKDDTVIVDGGGSKGAVDNRVKQLRAEIEATDSDWDREKLAGAAGQAGRRRRRHQGRGCHRDGAQGAQGKRRGRCRGGQGGCRRGHRHRRRLRADPGRQGARELRESLKGDEATGRRRVRRRAVRAAVLDRHQRRARRCGRGQQGQRAARWARLQRGHADLRRSGCRRRHRPGQGHPVGGAERGVGGQDGAHHRDGDRGQACRVGRRRSRSRSPPLRSIRNTPGPIGPGVFSFVGVR